MCNVADFHARNSDVDSSDEIGHLVQTFGLSCGGYNTGVGTFGAVPLYNAANRICLVSFASRSQSSMRCTDAAGSDKRRICYCSPTASPSFTYLTSFWHISPAGSDLVRASVGRRWKQRRIQIIPEVPPAHR